MGKEQKTKSELANSIGLTYREVEYVSKKLNFEEGLNFERVVNRVALIAKETEEKPGRLQGILTLDAKTAALIVAAQATINSQKKTGSGEDFIK